MIVQISEHVQKVFCWPRYKLKFVWVCIGYWYILDADLSSVTLGACVGNNIIKSYLQNLSQSPIFISQILELRRKTGKSVRGLEIWLRYSIRHYTLHTNSSQWRVTPPINRAARQKHVIRDGHKTNINSSWNYFSVFCCLKWSDEFVSFSSITHLCLVFSTYNLALRDESWKILNKWKNLFTRLCRFHLVSNLKSSIKIALLTMGCLEQLSSSPANVLPHFRTVRECLRLL